MAESLPEDTRLTQSTRKIDLAGKTPAGVWVIVGIALVFVIGGLGVGAFMAWKSIAGKIPSPVAEAAEAGRLKAEPSVASAPSGEAGVEHPKPMTADDSPPTVSSADRIEQDQVRQEVLKRIDLMRGLSVSDKDKLYVQVERARGFTRIGTVRFTQAGTAPGSAQMEGLISSLKGPGVRKLLADPTAILIMVGYADRQGEEARNVEVSRSRAENVVKILREKTDLANIMHTVGMGGQDIFDQSNLEKNRLVEVWAVQP